MKDKRIVRIATFVAKALLLIAPIPISDYEIAVKGTITGLTILPLLIFSIWVGAEMVSNDIKEMRADDELAPDESEAEDDEW